MNKRIRFYMRGLGVGIIITALILMISDIANGKNGGLTDAQIKERAAALGMVEASSYSLTDAVQDADKENVEENPSDMLQEATAGDTVDAADELAESLAEEVEQQEDASSEEDAMSEDPQDPEQTGSSDNTEAEGLLDNMDEDALPENTAEEDLPKNGEEETLPETPVDTSEETPTDQPVESPDTTPAEGMGGIVVITIYSGYGSDKIARLCEEAGLVSNAAEFDTFLVREGYSTSLRVGSFSIKLGATYEEIAKILTGVLQ